MGKINLVELLHGLVEDYFRSVCFVLHVCLLSFICDLDCRNKDRVTDTYHRHI